MSATTIRHLEVDENGRGLCSVPMWSGYGDDAGFCDREAYGKRPKCEMWRDGWTGEMKRMDGKYDGYVPGLACPIHGGPAERVFMDGNMWCAVRSDFVNLQESNAGFGETKEQAIQNLLTK